VLGEFVTGHSRKFDNRAGYAVGFLSEEGHLDKHHDKFSLLSYTAECHGTDSA
jgi:hypothetical protein